MKEFLLKANLYPVILKYDGEDGHEIQTNLGGHLNDVPEEFESVFWDSKIDSVVYYWDTDEEIRLCKAGEILQDNCRIISIGEPSYHEVTLVL